MTRFSEIAHDIESQFDPDYDIDPDSGAPPVRYIEHRLLELCETLDARLTALEAKPQAPDYWRKWAATEVEIKTAEMDAARAERNALAAEVDDLRNVNAGLRKHDVYLDNLVKSLQSRIAADIDDIAGLRKDNERLRTVYETDNARLRNALE